MRNSFVRVVTCLALVMMAVPAALVVEESLAAAPAFGAPPCPPGQPGNAPPGQSGSGNAPGRPSTYPIGQCELLLSTGVIPAGGTVTVTGTGYEAYVSVAISLDPGGVVLGSATANSGGSFTSNVTVPGRTPPGTYVLTATGGGQSLSAQLIVTSSAPADNVSNSGSPPPVLNAVAGTSKSNSSSSNGPHVPGTGSSSSSGNGTGGNGTTGPSNSGPLKSAAPATLGTHAKGGDSLVWIGAGVLALAIIAAGILFALRARRTA